MITKLWNDKILVRPSDKLHYRPSLLSRRSQPFSREYWFLKLRQKECLATVSIKFTWVLPLCVITITRQNGNHASQYLTSNCCFYCLGSGRGLYQLDISRNTCKSTTRCHCQSLPPCSWGRQEYSEFTWASSEDDHIKTVPSSAWRGTRETGFSQRPGKGWSWSGKLNSCISLTTSSLKPQSDS